MARIRRAWMVCVGCLLAAGAGDAHAQVEDLSKLSLEELINIEITTASRKEQTLARTAAAVYVLTDEDIRRSGARTIPDLLRLVPGFSVAQIDAGTWAVTARGFNGLYANKLLVLIDGRSVYTPLFGGVYWDMQSLPLGDIERIEVVRGPGGSLWGTNAVNGVVNIITKTADATQGGLAHGGVGGLHGAVGELRYGGRFSEAGRYRLFGRYAASATNRTVRGFADPDDADVGMGGVRLDWARGIDRITVHGSSAHGRTDHVRATVLTEAPWRDFARAPARFSEGNGSMRWTRSPSSRAETQVQASWAAYTRDVRPGPSSGLFAEHWHSAEIEGRQRRMLGRRHEIVGGFAYRFWRMTVDNTSELTVLPTAQHQHLATAFVQHEADVGRGVTVTTGLKAEPNLFTGLEWQPSLRLLWNPRPTHAVWAAATRAVRIPSIAERGVRIPAFAAPGPAGLPLVAVYEGASSAHSEVVFAYEAGYRVQAGRIFLDATVFTNQYETLLSSRAGAPAPGLVGGRLALVLPQVVANIRGGHVHGAEIAGSLTLVRWWRVSGSWSRFVFDPYPSSPITDVAQLTRTPARQAHVRTYVDLPGRGELTLLATRVGRIGATVPAYTSASARTAWPVGRSVRVSAGVDNLWHPNRGDFEDSRGVESSPVRPALVGDVSWRF